MEREGSMIKILIPLGSITSDLPGTRRFMECDTSHNATTHANSVVWYPDGRCQRCAQYYSGGITEGAAAMIEEIPYEERGEKGILVTMSKEDYRELIVKETLKGWLCATIGYCIGVMIVWLL